MTQHPITLDVRATDRGVEVKAAASIGRAFEGAKSLQAELRCIEIEYASVLAAASGALASAGKGRLRDPRAFWFAGKYLCEFIGRLESNGFYLVEKNVTLAKHLAISRASVEKIMSFLRRYKDPLEIDTSVPWSAYRDNKEHLRRTARRRKR